MAMIIPAPAIGVPDLFGIAITRQGSPRSVLRARIIPSVGSITVVTPLKDIIGLRVKDHNRRKRGSYENLKLGAYFMPMYETTIPVTGFPWVAIPRQGKPRAAPRLCIIPPVIPIVIAKTLTIIIGLRLKHN
jgi:hypothetical protein